MKKVLSFILVALLLISAFPLHTFTQQKNSAENMYDELYTNYQDVMEGWTWRQYLQNDSKWGFVKFSQEVDQSPFLRGIIKVALSVADGIDIHKILFDGTDALSGDDVEIGFYEDAIMSLLMTMEQDISADLKLQAKADATMTFKDYMVDGTEAIAGAGVGLFTDSTAVAKSLSTLVDGLSGSLDILSNTIDSLETQEQYISLSQYTRNYGQFERVLTAILNHSNDENLKQAARNAQNALLQCFEYKVNHFTNYLDDAVLPNLSSFLLDDVLTQALDEKDLKVTGLSKMCNFSKGVSAFNAGAKIGSFFANSVFGSNDIFLRYFEMRAMANIRACLIPEISNLQKSIKGPEDYQKIQKVQSYLYCLLYTCSRGEYCMYSMLTKDADMTGVISNFARKLISLVFKMELVDFQTWYTDASELMEYAKENIDRFNLNFQDIWLVSSEKEYEATGELYRETFYYYTSKGLLSKMESGNRITFYEYDENDRLVNEIIQDNPTQDADGSYREFIYAEDGKRLGIIYRNNDGSEHSRLMEAEYESYSGTTYSETMPGWADPSEQRIEYKYDGLGNIAEKTTYYDDELVFLSTMKYDEHNNIIQEIVEGDTPNQGVYDHQYTYDESGQIIAYKCYWGDRLIQEYTREYTDTEYVEHGYNFQHEYLQYIRVYTTDGKLLETAEYTSENELIMRTKYEYDENGNLKGSMMEGGFATKEIYEYLYDEFGNILQKELYLNGELSSTTVYTYEEYDGAQIIAKG